MGNRHCLYLIPQQTLKNQEALSALISFLKELDEPWTETEKISIQVLV